MNVLTVIAHPDDEILGMGGTICKHIEAGDKVSIIVITEPNEDYTMEYKESKRVAEKKVDKLLGTIRYHLDYPTVSLNTIPFGEFNKRINHFIERINPEIIYTHFKGDINQDHRIIYEACLVSTRPHKRIKLVCFETISETEWGDQPFKPNYYVDIADYMHKKIEAFSYYETEVKSLPHPRNGAGIITLANLRGLESGYGLAEAFRIVRWYA